MSLLTKSKKCKNYADSNPYIQRTGHYSQEIRDQFDLQPGDILSFDIESGDKIIIKPEKGSSDTAYGILHRENQEAFTVEEMESGVAEYFKKKYKTE